MPGRSAGGQGGPPAAAAAAGRCCRPPCLHGAVRACLPAVLWTGYLLAGAAVFHAVERPAAAVRRADLDGQIRLANRSLVGLFGELLDGSSAGLNASERERLMGELIVQLQTLAELDTGPDVEWTFMNSALFCMTVVSTIGYGYLSPKTQLGRGVCIAYALIGIPLNIIVMASAGKGLTWLLKGARRRLARCLARLRPAPRVDPRLGAVAVEDGSSAGRPRWKRYGGRPADVEMVERARAGSPDGVPTVASALDAGRSRRPTAESGVEAMGLAVTDGERSAEETGDDDHDVPFLGFVFLVLLYTCVFSMIMYFEELENHWTVLDSFYYIIITITTIGFGDLVARPAMSDSEEDGPGHYLLSCLAIAIPVLGMIILSAGISIVVNQFGKRTRAIERVLCGSREARA